MANNCGFHGMPCSCKVLLIISKILICQLIQFILASFRYKNLHRLQYITVVVILLISKVLILNIFSSEILSITINNPFSYIDSIEDLDKREDLQPILFVPDATVDNIQSSSKQKKSIARAMANGRQNKLVYDHAELFQKNVDIIFNNVSVKQSHVLLASELDLQMIIKSNKIVFGQMTHISREHYYDMIYGYIFRKDMNRFVARTYHQV